MPTLIAGKVFYDGALGNITEIEGSGAIQVDPITTASVITRKYCILRTNYLPPDFGYKTYTDPQYPQAWFVSEHVDKIEGALVFFNRIFCTVPGLRTELRLVPVTYPGVSLAVPGPGGIISWNKYGTAAPKTVLVNAVVSYTYVVQPAPGVDPTPLFGAIPALSQISYQGNVVDFCGDVYVPAGTVSIGNNRSAATWGYQGTTTPAVYTGIAPWVLSVEQKRYMGPIWEQAVVELPLGLVPVAP